LLYAPDFQLSQIIGFDAENVSNALVHSNLLEYRHKSYTVFPKIFFVLHFCCWWYRSTFNQFDV